MKSIFSDKNAIYIDPRSIIFTVFFILFLYFLYLIKGILVFIFLAFIMTVALHPMVMLLHKKLRIPKAGSIVITYLTVLVTLVTALSFLIPALFVQIQQAIGRIQIPPSIQEELAKLEFSLSEWDAIASRLGASANVLFNFVTKTFNGLVTTFTMLMLSFYMAREKSQLHKKIKWFTDDEAVIERVAKFIKRLEVEMGGWVRAEAALMTIIGVMTYVGLSLLSIPYALPLALLAGFLEILPGLGPTIAAIPAIAIAYLAYGPTMALIVLLFSIVVQQLENNIIVPKVMSINAHVNPLVGIITILIGVNLGGVIGGLLAIPTYIALRSAYATFVLKR